MKLLSLILLLFASMAFVLLGCSDNSAPIVAPSDQALSTATSTTALAKAGPVIHSASGNCGDFIDGGPVTFAFSAREYADGCSGEWQANLHGQPKEWGKMHGKVMSLKVYDYSGGKAAVVGGAFTDKINAGYYFAFVVVDNGEGKNAPPDKYTKSIVFTTSLPDVRGVWDKAPNDVVDMIVHMWVDGGYPTTTPEDILVPVKWGNVQVQ